tara:strand:+ start:578 stop:1900 length:1323 start_codon:yes stop_codon:yes gene_type:complete
MNCKQGWNQKFIIEETNKSFFDSKYKKSRKQFLLESEISKLPSTIAAAESYKQIKEEELNIKETDAKMRELKKQLDELRRIKYGMYENIRSLRNTGEKVEEKKKFVMPCPNNDCRGFLSTQYKCEICKLYTCPTCHEIIGHSKTDAHTCNPDSVQSAEQIKKDTKPCPNCGIRIFKISGCDQMWCTECEVAFSWNTGRVLHNVQIHNPHYYNRQRELNNGTMPRAPGDILCGGLCSFHQLRHNMIYPLQNAVPQKLRQMAPSGEEMKGLQYLSQKILDWHRFVGHITNHELVRIRQKILDLRDNKDLRIQYILKEKTREELADTVYRNDTTLKKLTEIHNIYEILSVVGIELFADLCNQNLRNLNINDAGKIMTNSLNEYKALITYSNSQLQDISATFGHSVIQIDENNMNMKYEKFTISMVNTNQSKSKNNSEAGCSYH